jgi:hypothetical protein
METRMADRIRIVQIIGAGEDIVALDSLGRAWILDEDDRSKKWEPLPEVPQGDLREVKEGS